MKYIRTKNGRLLKVRLEYHELPAAEDTIVYWTEIGEPFINRQDDFKLSDTIEELCDVIVIFQPPLFKPYIIDDTFEYVKRYYGSFYNWKEFIVKGAIWTDKGLIYVAKMNDKGELELL